VLMPGRLRLQPRFKVKGWRRAADAGERDSSS
jgi:hypothetical protein